ncbi:hypothetical protein XPA_006548 [Xanthoria parietina]
MSQSACNSLDKGPTTYAVEIRFMSPGAQPPVYVAGSFTLPKWQLHELECSIVEQDSTASDGVTSYVFRRTFDLPRRTYQYKFRLGHEGDWWVCDHSVGIVSDGLGNQDNRLVVTPPLPKPEALDTTVADEYSIDNAGNTAQSSAACPAMNGIKNLSNQDERGKTTTEEGPLPILDPSDSLRQRKQISVESSDSSGNKSPTPPATRRCLLQLFLHCLQTVWSVLLGGKAN